MKTLGSEESMRAFRVVKIVLIVIVASVLLGFVIEYLWNWLMPGIFGLRTITYWQAVGLFLLAKILLGGFHKHGKRGGRRHWRERMEAKMAKMSPEEREKFRSGMKGRFVCRVGDRDFGVDIGERHSKEETHEREAERG